SHPSGAPALILRLTLGGRVIAYTGDTAWTPAIADAAAGADLLIVEAYYWDKAVPHHLRHADLIAHRDELTARRTVLTHMSADMLGHGEQAGHQPAHDGLVLELGPGEARRPARSGAEPAGPRPPARPRWPAG